MKARMIQVFTLSLLVGTTLTRAAFAAPPPASQRTINPATGLAITMTTSAPGTASFEVASGRLTVRKDVLLGRSITTITSGGDRVTLVIDARGIVVTTHAGSVAASLSEPETMSQVVETLAESGTVSEAAALLSRLRLDLASTTGQALALTQALLESVSGDRRGTLAVLSWTSSASRHPRLVAVRVGLDPGDCWDAYNSAAAQAANEYADCYNSTSWYNLVGRLACSALYDVEVEGTWIGYLNCAGSSTR
jgi:hypothetical protein